MPAGVLVSPLFGTTTPEGTSPRVGEVPVATPPVDAAEPPLPAAPGGAVPEDCRVDHHPAAAAIPRTSTTTAAMSIFFPLLMELLYHNDHQFVST